jgi:hypothetical protein
MFEWPWTKAKRKREEEARAYDQRIANLNRTNPYLRRPYSAGFGSSTADDNAALWLALHAQNTGNNPTPYSGAYSPASEPDRSGDYGTRDHTGFKTGGGFGGESNHYGGSMESSYSSSSDSSSYSSDSGSSSDSGGGGGGD